MSKDIEVSRLKRWGVSRKQKKILPAFLLPREEKDKVLRRKLHLTGRPKKDD